MEGVSIPLQKWLALRRMDAYMDVLEQNGYSDLGDIISCSAEESWEIVQLFKKAGHRLKIRCLIEDVKGMDEEELRDLGYLKPQNREDDEVLQYDDVSSDSADDYIDCGSPPSDAEAPPTPTEEIQTRPGRISVTGMAMSNSSPVLQDSSSDDEEEPVPLEPPSSPDRDAEAAFMGNATKDPAATSSSGNMTVKERMQMLKDQPDRSQSPTRADLPKQSNKVKELQARFLKQEEQVVRKQRESLARLKRGPVEMKGLDSKLQSGAPREVIQSYKEFQESEQKEAVNAALNTTMESTQSSAGGLNASQNYAEKRKDERFLGAISSALANQGQKPTGIKKLPFQSAGAPVPVKKPPAPSITTHSDSMSPPIPVETKPQSVPSLGASARSQGTAMGLTPRSFKNKATSLEHDDDDPSSLQAIHIVKVASAPVRSGTVSLDLMRSGSSTVYDRAFVVLNNDTLYWFESKKHQHPFGKLSLVRPNVSVPTPLKDSSIVVVQCGSLRLNITLKSSSEQRDWVRQINKIVQKLTGERVVDVPSTSNASLPKGSSAKSLLKSMSGVSGMSDTDIQKMSMENKYLSISKMLQAGERFRKYKRGRAKNRWIWCSMDLDRLFWGENEDQSKCKGMIAVSDIIRIDDGCQGAKYQELAFTLVAAGRSLELQASNEHIKRKWVSAFRFLIRETSKSH